MTESPDVTRRPNRDMLAHMKRTTLIIDPALYTELRRRAATEGRTLTAVVESALRAGLAAGAAGRRARLQLPSYDLGPFLAGPHARDDDAPPAEETP
jgi:hypothetical protein